MPNQMTEKERELLENLFDSLDRLFDRHCQIDDVHDLLVATEVAFEGLNAPIELSTYINGLKPIITSGDSVEVKRERALMVTDPLRHRLSDLLDN